MFDYIVTDDGATPAAFWRNYSAATVWVDGSEFRSPPSVLAWRRVTQSWTVQCGETSSWFLRILQVILLVSGSSTGINNTLDMSAIQLPRRYVRSEFLGSGGFANVFAVFDKKRHEEVAIKRIDHGTDWYQTNYAATEIRLMKNMGNLDNHVMPCYDVLLDDLEQPSCTCIVMPKMSHDLFALSSDLRQKETLSEEVLSKWVLHILKALFVLHQHNVVHRDIKPENIFHRDDCGAIVGDFGLACSVDPAHNDNISAPVGTPEFIPPEQFYSPPVVTPANDIWSLGRTILALWTGRASTNRWDPTTQSPDWLCQYLCFATNRPFMSAKLRDLVARCLTIDYGKRATAGELLHHPWFCKLDPSYSIVEYEEYLMTVRGLSEAGQMPQREKEKRVAANHQQQAQGSANHTSGQDATVMLSKTTDGATTVQQLEEKLVSIDLNSANVVYVVPATAAPIAIVPVLAVAPPAPSASEITAPINKAVAITKAARKAAREELLRAKDEDAFNAQRPIEWHLAKTPALGLQVENTADAVGIQDPQQHSPTWIEIQRRRAIQDQWVERQRQRVLQQIKRFDRRSLAAVA